MVLETFPVGMLQCNCTLLGDEASGEAMVIDPGDDVPYILSRIKAHGLTLKQIVITHAHFDHVGGAMQLKRATGAPILLNENDLPLLAMMAEQPRWVGIDPHQLVIPEVAPPDVNAGDGLLVGVAGHKAEVLLTPGHTQGSICLHFAPEKLLVAGDTLFSGSIGRTDLPGGNARKLLESIHDRLLPLPDETLVIPGHGPETTIGAEREGNPWLG
jgi:glyoxylase-like metal-dependent hydrolase (beta-lactamase superfamily II)